MLCIGWRWNIHISDHRWGEARLAPLSKMMHNTEKQSVLEHTDVFLGGNWSWTRERNCDSCVCFFLNTKLTCGLLRVFFTTTCRYRVIKRSHSCLKHSVCSAGQVSLQTNDSVWSRCFSRPPLRTFMFFAKAVVPLETLRLAATLLVSPPC